MGPQVARQGVLAYRVLLEHERQRLAYVVSSALCLNASGVLPNHLRSKMVHYPRGDRGLRSGVLRQLRLLHMAWAKKWY